MLFNSVTFLWFFGIVLLLHSLPLPWSLRKLNLLLASYCFYAAWNPPFVLLLWLSTGVDWVAARQMARAQGGQRRAWLALSLAANLGLLGYFKYGGFLLDNFVSLMGFLGVQYQPAAPDIILPVGISFYTFQSLSYTLDIYHRRMAPCRSPLDFALYVAFFPQLVAGPIVRAVDFLPQCLTPRRATAAQLSWGITLLLLGLFEKIVLADALLAPIADKVFIVPERVCCADAWLGALAFSLQIFFDFAGYSTCAIGVALCLGFVLQDNFHFPYAAIGFSDFWRRWHISLSTWLRDYLYIPLGGNRRGARRTYLNLLVTMLLGGLWHGAAWTFVLWGGVHGLLLAAERYGRAHWMLPAWTRTRAGQVALAGCTYLVICWTWILFRAQSLADLKSLLLVMVGLRADSGEVMVSTLEMLMVLLLTAATFFLHFLLRERSVEVAAERIPWFIRGLLLAGVAVAIVTSGGGNRSFIYFQF